MRQLLDPKYEERSIVMDAQRAAKMNENPTKANSHEKGSWQHLLWLNVFASEKLRMRVEGKGNG